MVKTRDGIIVLLFMVAVTLLNASCKRGETVTGVVDGIWNDVTTKMPEISEDDLEAMQQQVELHLTKENDSWDSDSHIVGYEYIGNYILCGKSNKQPRYPYQIYLVNRVWIVINDDFSEILPYYYLVKFTSADLNEEGEWEINPKRNTPENGRYDVVNEASPYDIQPVEGYGTIVELYTSAIEEQLEQYKCTENIDEDKTTQVYFEQVDYAGINLMEEFEEAGGGTIEEVAQTDSQQGDYEDSYLAKWAEVSGTGVTEDGMYEYDAQGDTVTITKYLGQETEVVIPEEIAYRTRILLGASAFQGTHVIRVTLSDGVETIGFHTFHGCTDLKEVILGESVTTIEECAFYKCSSLESINIPPAVNFIEYNAFKGSAVTNISVKKGCEAEGLIREWSEPITVEYYD